MRVTTGARQDEDHKSCWSDLQWISRYDAPRSQADPQMYEQSLRLIRQSATSSRSCPFLLRPSDPNVIWHDVTFERDCKITHITFIKRELHPSEYSQKGFLCPGFKRPRLMRERLENERDALSYISQNTTIPVPRVLQWVEKDGRCALVTERMKNVVNASELMHELADNERDILARNVTTFVEEIVLPQLRNLRSNKLGGLCGHVLPCPLISDGHKRRFESRTIPREEYVFCHGDLAKRNIMVNRQSLQPVAVVDWEYAGFYPRVFEEEYWIRLLKEPAETTAWIKNARNALEGPPKPYGPVGKLVRNVFAKGKRCWAEVKGEIGNVCYPRNVKSSIIRRRHRLEMRRLDSMVSHDS
ncbi:hypothetical protein MMC21_002768 [Puttea exsequens]|nr:hypothetical protein [Puttea exsequens]